MAINKLRKFRTIDEVQNFLNGGIQGSVLKSAQGGGTPANIGAGVNGLVGTTLTFSLPTAASVTFVRADGAGGSAAPPGTNPDPYTLLLKDIKAQIEANIAGTLVNMFDGALIIREATPSGGVVLKGGSVGGYATVVGTVDLRTLSYGSGGSVDGLVLTLKHDGGSNLVVTFAAPANQGAIVTQINAVTVAGGITASINGFNQLVLQSSDQGGTASIEVVSGTSGLLGILGLPAATTVVTGAATNTANTLLGFDLLNDTVGKFYTPAEVTPTAPCWTWAYSGNDNMHAVYTYE
jgi:hypothetical protein